jgi:hypothetical protein
LKVLKLDEAEGVATGAIDCEEEGRATELIEDCAAMCIGPKEWLANEAELEGVAMDEGTAMPLQVGTLGTIERMNCAGT